MFSHAEDAPVDEVLLCTINVHLAVVEQNDALTIVVDKRPTGR